MTCAWPIFDADVTFEVSTAHGANDACWVRDGCPVPGPNGRNKKCGPASARAGVVAPLSAEPGPAQPDREQREQFSESGRASGLRSWTITDTIDIVDLASGLVLG